MKSFIIALAFTTGFAFHVFSQIYTPFQKITAADRSSGALFGASVSISDNYAIMGAQHEEEDSTGNNTLINAGAAYIYELDNNGRWQQRQKLVPADRTEHDYFGGDVSISGNLAIVSAFEKNVNGGITYPHAGAVYIFERDGNGSWNEITRLVAGDTGASDHFGYKIAISGNYIIVGSPIDAEDSLGNNTLTSTGSAYIFEKDGNGNWNQVQKLSAPVRAIADLFGASVSISNNYAIVGAYQEDEDSADTNTLNNSGSAYIYERDVNGHWDFVQKIVAADRNVSDRFAIAVSVNGSSAIIGAYLEDEDALGNNTKTNAGAAYIYQRDGNGHWNQVKKIVSPDRDANDYFGQAVYINGNYAAAGSQNESTDIQGGNPLISAGAAYIYERDTNGNWTLLQKLVASDRATNDYFGSSMSLNNNYVIVGAHLEDEDTSGVNPLNASGSGYAFKFCNSTSSTVYDTACADYISPSGNHIWVSSGTYMDTVINSLGCDSILTVHLHLKNTTSTLYETVCDSYVSPSGQYVWMQTNIYTDTLPNSQNCDSIITIHLTVNSNSSVINASSCSTYTSPSGQYIWTSSGTYQDTLTNANGCDSVISVHLSINNSSAIIYESACVSYASPGGHVWSSTGTYHDTISNSKGCDSLLTIHLSIGTQSSTSVVYKHACYSYISVSGQYTWTASGTYMDTIPNAQGCDSIITIHLTITNATTNSVIYVNECYSYVSPSQQYVWLSSGTYHDTIPNANGCDSIITIHLSINHSDTLIFAEACNAYTSPSDNYVWNSSGTYTDTVINAAGCDSVISIVLTINMVNTNVSTNGLLLEADAAGAAYQWLNCDNNFTLISDAINQQFTAIGSGNYAVTITLNGCVDTSACYSVNDLNVSQNLRPYTILIFPNPVTSSLTVLMEELQSDELTIELYAASGQVVYSNTINILPGTNKHVIETNTLTKGMYFVSVRSVGVNYLSKLIIEK